MIIASRLGPAQPRGMTWKGAGGWVPGDKQDENLATIRMRKMTPAA
jgi:hypothetical protein